jgi:hypothetical protein
VATAREGEAARAVCGLQRGRDGPMRTTKEGVKMKYHGGRLRGACGAEGGRRTGEADARVMTHQVCVLLSFFLGVEIEIYMDADLLRNGVYTPPYPTAARADSAGKLSLQLLV